MHLITNLTTPLAAAQDVRQSHGVLARFHGIMGDLLADVRRTPPSPNSIAAHLLGIEDPRTGEQEPPLRMAGWVMRVLGTGHMCACVHVPLQKHDSLALARLLDVRHRAVG